MPTALRLSLLLGALVLGAAVAQATSNYDYGADEYQTIATGLSPDGKYAITTHGEGDLGYDNFHVFLTDAVSGRKIGPLEEISDFLDTGADAYCAKWSKNSQQVVIIYRIDRHLPLQTMSYRIAQGRAARLKGPDEATKEQAAYWRKECSKADWKGKVFGTPKQQ